MKEQIKPVTLSAQQINDRDFLYEISRILYNSDLSKIDLKTIPGTHRAHSVLFDNYELNITRTPVFVHKNKFMHFFGLGNWKYQDGKYERYEICVMENVRNMRVHDIMRYMGDDYHQTHRFLIHYGTMASDQGYFAATKHELTDYSEDLFYNQNAHLFLSARRIYNALDDEYNRRTGQNCDHKLPVLKTAQELQLARNSMLDCLKSKQK